MTQVKKPTPKTVPKRCRQCNEVLPPKTTSPYCKGCRQIIAGKKEAHKRKPCLLCNEALSPRARIPYCQSCRRIVARRMKAHEREGFGVAGSEGTWDEGIAEWDEGIDGADEYEECEGLRYAREEAKSHLPKSRLEPLSNSGRDLLSFSEGVSEASPDKPLWQMTRGEFQEYKWGQGERNREKINQEYFRLIMEAVSEGKPVDPSILAEYRHLPRKAWQIPFAEWQSVRKQLQEKGDVEALRDIGGLTTDCAHRYNVEQAVKQGKPVPREVLKDYPDLDPERPRQ